MSSWSVLGQLRACPTELGWGVLARSHSAASQPCSALGTPPHCPCPERPLQFSSSTPGSSLLCPHIPQGGASSLGSDAHPWDLPLTPIPGDLELGVSPDIHPWDLISIPRIPHPSPGVSLFGVSPKPIPGVSRRRAVPLAPFPQEKHLGGRELRVGRRVRAGVGAPGGAAALPGRGPGPARLLHRPAGPAAAQ